MDIRVRNQGGGREVLVSSQADWALFDELTQLISIELADGEWIARLDGLDERYWDYRVGEGIATLHLQHYLGVTLLASPDSRNQNASDEVVDRIARVAAAYQPGRSQSAD